MNFPEAKILSVAINKLRSEGWRVVCEIPVSGRMMDAIAYKDGKLITIESKTSLNYSVVQQAMTAQLSGDMTLVVISSKPKENNRLVQCLEKEGIGIWVIKDGEVEIFLAPKQNDPNPRYYERAIKYATEGDESVIGGLPCMSGDGPAQRVMDKINDYKSSNPKVTWRELFDIIPNHYSSYQSMRSSMRLAMARKEYKNKDTNESQE